MQFKSKLSLFLILWRLQVLAFGSSIALRIPYPIISPNAPYAHPELRLLTSLAAYAKDTPNHSQNKQDIRHMKDISLASHPSSKPLPQLPQDASDVLTAPGDSSAPSDVTTQRQKAKLHMKMSEATAMERDLDGLAKVANSLAEALHSQKEAPAPANTQLQETMDANESLAKDEAAERAVNEETAKEMEVEKEQLAEAENEVEGQEDAEEAEDNAKLERKAEQEEAKDMIEDAKDDAEAAAEKDTKAGLEEQEKNAVERSILEEADINKNLTEDVETEALMKESSEKTASNRDRDSVVEALHNDARRIQNAQEELKHRKQLLTNDETQAQQSKLVNQLEERLGTAVQHCFNDSYESESVPSTSFKTTTSSEALRTQSAKFFLKKRNTLDQPLSRELNAELRRAPVRPSILSSTNVSSSPASLLRRITTRTVPSEKAFTDKTGLIKLPISLTFHQNNHEQSELMRTEKSHPRSDQNNSSRTPLSLSQWLYFTVFFPAGIGASAFLLVLFV